MLRRSKRNISIGFTVSVFVITIIIFLANIHRNIQHTSEFTSTSKYDTAPNFMGNNAFCMNKVSPTTDFRTLNGAICPVRDKFDDLSEAIEYIESKIPPVTQTEPVTRIADFLNISPTDNLTALDKFNLAITQYELYSSDTKLVDQLLHDMATRTIVRVDEKNGGTQFKLKIRFDNEMYAIVKPMRFPRDQQAQPDQLQYAEFESHTAEIAAFHLDRILGFRRAMPVTGRILNMTSEIIAVGRPNLTDTHFISPQPDNNHCVIGNCDQYCTFDYPICAEKDMIETAIIGYLPFYFSEKQIYIEESPSPWKRSYNNKRNAIWERDPQYCDRLKKQGPFNKGRLLLDLMDVAIFDFMTGNRDRHSYGHFSCFDEDTFLLHYDNGRGFGRPFYDDPLNLMPMVQCCMIRSSTLKTLLSFQNGSKPLSQLMRESMASDPIAPILWEPHLEALDRRVGMILKTVRECIELNTVQDVIYPRDNFGEKPRSSI